MESNDISFSLEQRKYKVNDAMKGNQSVTFEKLEELEKLDNTNKDVLFSILQTNKNNKELLFTSFDILEKKQLQELEITKELSNKQSYFYFLKYMNHVKIIDDILVDDKVKEKVGDEVKITEIQNEEKIKEQLDLFLGVSDNKENVSDNVANKEQSNKELNLKPNESNDIKEENAENEENNNIEENKEQKEEVVQA